MLPGYEVARLSGLLELVEEGEDLFVDGPECYLTVGGIEAAVEEVGDNRGHTAQVRHAQVAGARQVNHPILRTVGQGHLGVCRALQHILGHVGVEVQDRHRIGPLSFACDRDALEGDHVDDVIALAAERQRAGPAQRVSHGDDLVVRELVQDRVEVSEAKFDPVLLQVDGHLDVVGLLDVESSSRNCLSGGDDGAVGEPGKHRVLRMGDGGDPVAVAGQLSEERLVVVHRAVRAVGEDHKWADRLRVSGLPNADRQLAGAIVGRGHGRYRGRIGDELRAGGHLVRACRRDRA